MVALPLISHSNMQIIIIIIIINKQDLYSANSLRSALHQGRQYSHNTNQYRMDQRALLVRAYNLEGRVKWNKG